MIHKNFNGLSDQEILRSRLENGENTLKNSKKTSALSIMLGVVREPMFILLIVCASLYMILGDIQEGVMLLGFVIVIMGIEFYQERKTEKALDALKDLAAPHAIVIRDSVERVIPSSEIVVGDIIVLREGDRVPADATILQTINISLDESLLTGESLPVSKCEWDGKQTDKAPGGSNTPFVYSGCMVVQGNALAVVTKVGAKTQIGVIGSAIEDVVESPTKLKKEIGRLVKYSAIAGVLLCVAVVLIYTMTRGDLLKGFLAGLTLAMAMLPEEFPVVLTIFMALGAWRISRINVLARRPSAIETLGSATVLCSDKTGTITQNKMSVASLWNGENFLSVKNIKTFPEEYHKIIEYGILSSQTKPFDPMEQAICKMGDDFLHNTEHIHHDWQMLREYPLSKQMLSISRVFDDTQNIHRVIAAKGAAEAICDLCHLGEIETQKVMRAVEEMAGKGLRVLAVAMATLDSNKLPEAQHDFDFEFVGLIGLADPIRENVPDAVAQCRQAGIRVIMITGDYPVTAQNIAREIGIENPDEFITGSQLNDMSSEELARRIRFVNVFARVIPEQKLKIVEALKSNGEIVAMTGDGVNDAPALKAANIGVAMGKKGTDVAREASELVLMDDNFSSIMGAIRMGRRIFDNLQKSLAYIFAIHVPIAALSLIPVLSMDLPLILWPIHVVFLELIIDPACSIIFEAEGAEKNVMSNPPKGIDEPFFGKKKIILAISQGVNILLCVLAVYFGGLFLGLETDVIRAMSFTTLIVANIATIFTNRSWERSIWSIIRRSNPAVKWVVGGASVFLVVSLSVPYAMGLFQFGSLSVSQIALCILAGVMSIVWFEAYKFFVRRG